MSTAKSYGTTFETDVLEFLRVNNVDAERLVLTGQEDEGDLVLRDQEGVIIAQLKARRDRNSQLSLHAWLRDALSQSVAYSAHRNLPYTPMPILVVKNARHPISDAFVVMRLGDFVG